MEQSSLPLQSSSTSIARTDTGNNAREETRKEVGNATDNMNTPSSSVMGASDSKSNSVARDPNSSLSKSTFLNKNSQSQKTPKSTGKENTQEEKEEEQQKNMETESTETESESESDEESDEESKDKNEDQSEKKATGVEENSQGRSLEDRVKDFKARLQRLIRAIDEHGDNEEFVDALATLLEGPRKMVEEIDHVKREKLDPRTFNFQSPLARMYFDYN